MSNQPVECLYCDGEGNSSAGGQCGFCESGNPLDTQGDWDNSWGRIMENLEEIRKDPKAWIEKILKRSL